MTLNEDISLHLALPTPKTDPQKFCSLGAALEGSTPAITSPHQETQHTAQSINT